VTTPRLKLNAGSRRILSEVAARPGIIVENLEAAKVAALDMIALPREQWKVLPRCWVKI
jgi:hypothetical protein